MPLIAAFIFV